MLITIYKRYFNSFMQYFVKFTSTKSEFSFSLKSVKRREMGLVSPGLGMRCQEHVTLEG